MISSSNGKLRKKLFWTNKKFLKFFNCSNWEKNCFGPIKSLFSFSIAQTEKNSLKNWRKQDLLFSGLIWSYSIVSEKCLLCDVIYGRPKKGLPKCNKGKKVKKRKNGCCMDILVVGAGVSGLAAAGLLSKAGTVNQN